MGKHFVGGNKLVSVKNTDLKVLDCEGFPNSAAHTIARDFLTLLHTPVSAIFIYASKLDNAAIAMLHCILG